MSPTSRGSRRSDSRPPAGASTANGRTIMVRLTPMNVVDAPRSVRRRAHTVSTAPIAANSDAPSNIPLRTIGRRSTARNDPGAGERGIGAGVILATSGSARMMAAAGMRNGIESPNGSAKTAPARGPSTKPATAAAWIVPNSRPGSAGFQSRAILRAAGMNIPSPKPSMPRAITNSQRPPATATQTNPAAATRPPEMNIARAYPRSEYRDSHM